MKRRLLFKRTFNLLTIIVLYMYLQSPSQFPGQPIQKAAALSGTDPVVTISSPESGSFTNQSTITISGAVKNFTSAVTVSIHRGEEIGSVKVPDTENAWSLSVPLIEGPNELYIEASDSGGVKAPGVPLTITSDTVLPTISFLNKTEGAFSNIPAIEMETEPGSEVKICIDCTEKTGEELESSWITVPETPSSSGNFVYENPQMNQGKHVVFAKATDRAGNVGNPFSISFILDTLRPIILPSSLDPKPGMSQVAIDIKSTLLKFRILDANKISENELKESLTLVKSGALEPVPIRYVGYTEATKEVIFELTQPLERSTKYHVAINPSGVLDAAGNEAFPRFWSFTTESSPSHKVNGRIVYDNINYNGKNLQRESPHGVYSNNFNTCGNCHSTHAASNPKLLDQKKNSENDNGDLTVDQYCMACHDGTVAPKAENSGSKHSHNAGISMDGTITGSSCSSCHNPHSEWSTANPILTQGHFTYTHDDTIPQTGKPSGEISSKAQLCETCHETETANKLANQEVKYNIFEYKNANTAIGIYEDYGLCLRCHNPEYQKINEKTAKAADIAQYYSNLTKQVKADYEEINGESSFIKRTISPAELVFSGHTIKALDGSPLAGHIPCADCHDTHGSLNIKQLKTTIGHENKQPFAVENDDWTPEVERSFCLKCHNGSTAIYGVKGKIPDPEKSDGHLDSVANKDIPCSKCHGIGKDAREKAMNAAHAPRKAMPSLSKLEVNNQPLNESEVSNQTLSPKFSPYSLNYTVKVDNSVSTVTVIGEPKDSNDTISGTGNKALNVGLNNFTVTVKSPEGKETSYTITVNRAAPKP
ncbi:cadherin-like beta sandwich domain-containing protein [Bacillus sp. FJAT-27245]|uniref:cadherin-like beta sandwich domain-containing protein n=1 Tax=Bacillus sp. FJAT-27245 TaxID=1684144 RepID=UPI0006A7E175|nr:cadherin-like beta sandwich domain-containing protein [Bacillus sp. FJAT-27245]